MIWYNPKKWLNLNTAIIVVAVIVALVFIGTIIVGLALANVPIAKFFLPFLGTGSGGFPTKAIAFFTALATFGTLFLALTMIYALKLSKEKEENDRTERLDREERGKEERLLKEIVEWAFDVTKCGLERDILASWDPEKDEPTSIRIYQQIEYTFRVLLKKSRYIKGFVLPKWSKLRSLVKQIRTELGIHIDHLVELTKQPTNKAIFDTAHNHRDTVNGLAAEIIDEACKILTRLSD